MKWFAIVNELLWWILVVIRAQKELHCLFLDTRWEEEGHYVEGGTVKFVVPPWAIMNQRGFYVSIYVAFLAVEQPEND
jgi:hypothetical protein